MDNTAAIERHKKLLTDISDLMVPESAEYENFVEHMKVYVPRGILSQRKTLLAKFDALATKGHLKVGGYDTLMNIAQTSNNNDVVDMINAANVEIKALIGNSEAPAPSTSLNQATEYSSQTKVDARETYSTSKRPRLDTEEESDPLFFQQGDESYYDYRNKKGLMLILNSRENRTGTDEDVKNLKLFFRDVLNFDVYDPRSDEQQDLTTEQFENLFKEIRSLLNNELMGKSIYCFLCVILAHGREGEFHTKDGAIQVEYIRKQFNNHHVPNFTGKPKVFFIQACRGTDIQSGEEIDDADDIASKANESDNNIDEADEIIRLPSDADTLFAFATTPGYQAFRRTGGSRIGSWFITECVDVFKNHHKRHHLEDMLITVREKVAHHWTKASGGKQMPCVWSTLTKRLMLVKKAN